MSPRNRKEPVGAASVGRVLLFGGSAWLLGLAVSAWLGQPTMDVVSGSVHAKAVSVSVAHEARLAQLFVSAGDCVKPSAPLFRLNDDRLAVRVATKQREIAALQAEVQQAEAAAVVDLEWRRRELNREVFETQLKLKELKHAQVHHQVEQVAWQERAIGLDYWIGDWNTDAAVRPMLLPDTVPPVRLLDLLRADAVAMRLEAAGAQLEECERKLGDLAELDAKLSEKVRISAGVEVIQVKLNQAAAELKILEDQQQALTVCSPGHGTVGSLSVQVGDTLTAGQSVIELLDADQRFVIARVPSSQVGRFEVGKKVVVIFPPRQRLQGTIAEIPPEASKAGGTADPEIAVRIEPCGKLWPAMPVGSAVSIELPH